MNFILKRLAQRSEQDKNKLLAYTTVANNLSGSWNMNSLPYQAWQEETRNLKVK